MASHRGWLAVGVGALLCFAAAPVIAQQAWQRLYEEGFRAYDKGDYITAEAKMLASVGDPASSEDRGLEVLVRSQIRGYFPEAYLARISLELGKRDEALRYGEEAMRYLRACAVRLPDYAGNLCAVVKAQTLALAPGPSPSASEEFKTLMAAAEEALGGGDFFTARQQAQDAGQYGDASAFLAGVDRIEASERLTEAQEALDRQDFERARGPVDRALRLGADATQASALLAEIDRRELDSLVARAEVALAQSRLGLARSFAGLATQLATRTVRLRADRPRVAELAARIDAAESAVRTEAAYARERETARAALQAGRWNEARAAADRVGATGLHPNDVIALRREIDTAEAAALTSDILAAMARGAPSATLRGQVVRLGELDPTSGVLVQVEAYLNPRVVAPPVGGEVPSPLLRTAVASFYAGRYHDAIATFDSIEKAGTSDLLRVRLYRAGSRAALALIGGEHADEYQQQAAEEIAAVRSQLARVAADLRYLSPRVRERLGIGGELSATAPRVEGMP